MCRWSVSSGRPGVPRGRGPPRLWAGARWHGRRRRSRAPAGRTGAPAGAEGVGLRRGGGAVAVADARRGGRLPGRPPSRQVTVSSCGAVPEGMVPGRAWATASPFVYADAKEPEGAKNWSANRTGARTATTVRAAVRRYTWPPPRQFLPLAHAEGQVNARQKHGQRTVKKHVNPAKSFAGLTGRYVPERASKWRLGWREPTVPQAVSTSRAASRASAVSREIARKYFLR